VAPGQTFAPGKLAWVKTDQPIALTSPLEAVVVRPGDPSFYVRLRPSGTVNATSETIANPTAQPALGDVIGFPYVFPSAGRYQVFLNDPQGHSAGPVDVEVQAAGVG
jgi:hypothetical protein